jgi:hypothetical protein
MRENLRETRATELVSDGWPEYKVCKWLGHTKLVAERRYWQVTDEDYEKAALPVQRDGTGVTEIRGPNMDQLASVKGGLEAYKKGEDLAFPEKNEVLRTYTDVDVGGTGLEPATSTV